MSLRFRLISLVVIVLILSLALGGGVAGITASRSVATEMDSARKVALQTIETGLAGLRSSDNPRRDLEHLVASFQGNRHLRVSLSGDGDAIAAPKAEAPPLGEVPHWFVAFINVPPTMARVPVSIGDRSYGTLLVETVPHNEILEVWNEFSDSLLILILFSGASMLLIYLFVGRALRPLERMANALETIGHGDFSVRLDGELPPDLARLRDNFNRMAGQLAAISDENRRLNEQLLSLQEQERSELASDLHDEIGPFLFAINIDAANIARHVRDGALAPIGPQIQSIAEAVSHMQKQVKQMLGRLRPIGLAEFGLAQAIGNLVDFWRRRHPAIDFEIAIGAAEGGFGDLIDTVIFRVVQECLSNAVRHGAPNRIEVSIAREAQRIIVTVFDDGQGTDTAPAGIGYGLLGMTERVRAIGGHLTFSSRPGEGFRVTAELRALGQEALAS